MKNEKKVSAEEETLDVTLLARLLDENNDENIFLFNEDGDEIEFEQIATLYFESNIYAIMHPLDADEDEAVVFVLDPKDEESINVVDDDELAEKVLDFYHEQAGV